MVVMRLVDGSGAGIGQLAPRFPYRDFTDWTRPSLKHSGAVHTIRIMVGNAHPFSTHTNIHLKIYRRPEERRENDISFPAQTLQLQT